MQDEKSTKTAKMLKAAATPAALATIAIVFLASARLCPDCRSNPTTDQAERNEPAKGKVMVDLNVDNFAASIAEGITLVDFWAPWCGPCRAVAPVLEEVAAEYKGKAKIVKVNADEETAVAGSMGIQSIPTIALFHHGEVKNVGVGAQPKQTPTSTARQRGRELIESVPSH